MIYARFGNHDDRMGFGEIVSRSGIDLKTRQLVTIPLVSLSVMPNLNFGRIEGALMLGQQGKKLLK
jgi:hypothetical protein